jgi:hypothetical protein
MKSDNPTLTYSSVQSRREQRLRERQQIFQSYVLTSDELTVLDQLIGKQSPSIQDLRRSEEVVDEVLRAVSYTVQNLKYDAITEAIRRIASNLDMIQRYEFEVMPTYFQRMVDVYRCVWSNYVYDNLTKLFASAQLANTQSFGAIAIEQLRKYRCAFCWSPKTKRFKRIYKTEGDTFKQTKDDEKKSVFLAQEPYPCPLGLGWHLKSRHRT